MKEAVRKRVTDRQSRELFLRKGPRQKKLTIKIIALEEIQSTKRNCDQCKHTLESQKESLKQPSIIFQSRSIETHLYPCETCEFTSISREDMTAHAKSRICCMSQENIDANIGSHHETEQLESFSCDQCDYETMQPEYLNRHKIVHEGSAFRCDRCDKMLLLIIWID